MPECVHTLECLFECWCVFARVCMRARVGVSECLHGVWRSDKATEAKPERGSLAGGAGVALACVSLCARMSVRVWCL